jgi:hypothetical protein
MKRSVGHCWVFVVEAQQRQLEHTEGSILFHILGLGRTGTAKYVQIIIFYNNSLKVNVGNRDLSGSLMC